MNTEFEISRAVQLTALGGIAFLITAAFRLWGINGESLWYDEILVTRNLDAQGLGEFLRRIHLDNPPVSPLYFAVVYFWAKLGGGSILGLRLLSVLIASCTSVVIFRMGARHFSLAAGFAAAWIHAAAIDAIYFGQEIRMYALTVLLAALSLSVFLRLLRDREDDSHSDWLWIALVAGLNSLMLQTHLVAALLVVAEGLALLLFRRDQWRLAAVFGVIHAIAVLPALLWIGNLQPDQVDGGTQWIEVTRMPDPATALVWLSTWVPGGMDLDEIPARVVTWIMVVVILAFTIHRAATAKSEARRVLLALLLCAWLPVILLAIASVTLRPMFVPRYVLFSMVPFILLLAGVITTVSPPWFRRALYAALILLSHCGWSTAVRPYRADWETASQYLEERARAGDTVIVLPGRDQTAAAHYLPSDPRNGIFLAWTMENVPQFANIVRSEQSKVLAVGTTSQIWEARRAFKSSDDPSQQDIFAPTPVIEFHARLDSIRVLSLRSGS